jgi:hypothetical protein
MNRERSLAHIETITDIRPIEGKDRIVLAKVLGWNVVIGKDEFKVGDNVVYVEIDSRLNTGLEPFRILVKDADRFGFAKIKTRKFGDSYSQGICFAVPDEYVKYKAGTDVTEYFNKGKEGKDLAIIHNEEYSDRRAEWERPWKKPEKLTMWKRFICFIFPGKRKGSEKGKVPSPFDVGVKKTDEERIQNLTELFENLKARRIALVATEKVDGQSFTAYIDQKGKVYVASRNMPLLFIRSGRTRTSFRYAGSGWQKAYEKYSVKEVLMRVRKNRGGSVTIQGEVIGCGIQGNPYKIAEGDVQLKVFNILVNGKRVPYEEMRSICVTNGLDAVPYLGTAVFEEDLTMEGLIARSDGMSELNGNTIREGIVYRTEDYGTSFKAISNVFLMKRGE